MGKKLLSKIIQLSIPFSQYYLVTTISITSDFDLKTD